MDMVWVLDQAWCRENGVQVRLLCIGCQNEAFQARAKRPVGKGLSTIERDAVGGRDDAHTRFADLTAWTPQLGLSIKLYEYICPLGHKNYAEMSASNAGQQGRLEPADKKLRKASHAS